jgi:ribosomal protein S18 acetylase RimI-like enzyme
MQYAIRPATINDAEGIGYVHSTAWKDTYAGMIDAAFLADLSPEKSAARFRALGMDGLLVLTADGQIVGFSKSGKTLDDDLPSTCGDVHAIYLLKDYQKYGLGKKLLDASIKALRSDGFDMFSIWVLDKNENAIGFYEKYGFAADGTVKLVIYNTLVTCKRYIFNREK